MSFVNLTRTGFETMSQYGKLIGTGKNNGIKVFEKLESDGKRILTSIDKEGNPIKKIATERNYSTFITNTENYKTNVKTHSLHEYLSDKENYLYHFKKRTPADNSAESSIDTFALEMSITGSKGDSLRDLRKSQKEAFQNKKNINFVRVEQAKGDNSYYRFDAMPKTSKYSLNSEGDYKINDDIILPNGDSVYFYDGKNNVEHNAQSNVHEANIAKSFIEGLQKIWS